MVTYAQLNAATTQPLHGGADSARKMARELEEFGGETDRQRQALSGGWSGTDASAATNLLLEYAGKYRGVAQSYGRIDEIVSMLANEIDAAKQQLQSAVASAPSIPGRVGEDGTVHVNWEALGPQPSPAAVSAAQQRATQVAGWIKEAMTRAFDADGQAGGALASILNPQSGSDQSQSGIPQPGTDPGEVNSWWNGLSDEQRQAAIAADPKGVGGLDGVPISARDQANRLALSAELDEVTASHAAAEEQLAGLRPGSPHDMSSQQEFQEARKEVGDLNGRLENLNSIQQQLGRTDMLGSNEQLNLIDYDSAADGQLVISAGNPDTADNVVTYVPGMTTDVEGIGPNVDRSLLMQADAAAAAPGQSTASVMWLGYDAPDGAIGAAGDKYYEAAAGDLTSFQQGLRVTHEGPESMNTLLGHSYGSSTVGYAASQADMGIDNLVFVASPGATVDSAGDFQGIGADHVFATRSDSDIIEWVPEWFHGNDPVDADFGGRVFPGGEGGHSDYWNDGNVAREGITDIVTGQADQLPVTMQDPGTLRMEPAGR